jgi:arginase family enzyme
MNEGKMRSAWPSIAELIVSEGPADVALIGAPMEAGSVTPGRCDRAPATIRQTLRRFSTYDVETGKEIDLRLLDAGDIDVRGVMPAQGFEAIRDGVAACAADHRLTLLLGGNNAVTRPAAHALGYPLGEVGLITLDAHFDLRDTDKGLLNGNPIRALLEDGLPGRNICQIGISPFANTARMHATAIENEIGVISMAQVKRLGIISVLEGALARLAHCPAVMVDFDIDVIDRSQCPGAPGARPGGMPVDMFFQAARFLGAERKVKLVDLTEFDPSLDIADITALTAGRWVAEVLAGFATR